MSIIYIIPAITKTEQFYRYIKKMLRRKRALKILTMIPPEDSVESSEEDIIVERVESPLLSESIEEDLDELLKEFELNALDDVIV